jgi:GR25 family glycosyltransferase involved in LPS biosynthesis
MVSLDRIYVINLRRRKNKKDRISNLLLEEGLGIPVEITEAFDFGSLDINLLSHWLKEQNCRSYPNWKTTESKMFEGFNFGDWDSREIKSAEIGCALSHINIWKKIIANKETALILEDDAFWHTGKLKKFITKSLPECPDADILYFGRNKASKKEEKSASKDALFVEPAFSYNAHAYAIGSESASKLLSTDILKNLVGIDEFLVGCWTKHRRDDLSKIFPPILKAVSSNLSKFEIWQQSLSGPYVSDIEGAALSYGAASNKKIYCFTVADNPANEGLEKHIRSSAYYDVPIKILGLDSPWGGGDMVNDPGGGQKINLLIPELEKLKSDPNAIVLFVDGYDVLFLDGLENIVNLFLSKETPVLFSAEKSCWPDRSLVDKYPDAPYLYKFLNSGTFIGYAVDLYKITERARKEKLPNIADDQLYYTNEFLYGKYKHLISLDYKCEIFQCLGGAYEDIKIKKGKLYNTATNSKPLIAHGNSGKEEFWYVSNYLSKKWNSSSPFFATGNLKGDPIVYISLYCVSSLDVASWNVFFSYIAKLNFPKSNIILHIEDPQNKLETIKESIDVNEYKDVLYTSTNDEKDEGKRRNLIFKESLGYKYDYHFYVENLCLLKNPETLNELIKTNKNIVAPMLRETIDNKVSNQANFWGAFSDGGYYKQSENYFDILERKDKKCWTVPFVGACYLIKRKIIEDHPNPYTGHKDLDLAFVKNLGYKRVLFHTDNRHDYGIINWRY